MSERKNLVTMDVCSNCGNSFVVRPYRCSTCSAHRLRDANLEDAERRAAAAGDEIERLREALRDAIEEVEFWSCYASDYFKDKHDLDGTMEKLRAALKEHGDD